MNYYLLKSVLSAGKSALPLSTPSASFRVAPTNAKAYIEPNFEKVFFETEKPTIIIVSAVGATGKTALSLKLSRDLGLPLLDLAKHKPVGDNTLTGILTSAFDVKDITKVLGGLASGEYAVIIDGIDEGRSKTTEKAFEAFLDDIVKLCRPHSPTTFLLLGRTQIVDACWDYLSTKGIPTALITISPFTLAEASKYIDTFTEGSKAGASYVDARDAILKKLSRAFSGTLSKNPEDFLAFIGYPPVLDAIVTLLSEERNYHKLLQGLDAPDGQNVEVQLLNRIAQYILNREKDSKVIPNILTPILEDAPEDVRQRALTDAFSTQEQSARLVAYCLGKQQALGRLGVPVLDEQYEARLETWLPEHPFISGREFRNAVFEALALATLIVSKDRDSLELLDEYVRSHKHSYHLIYMLDILATDRRVPLSALAPVFTAAMEFRSVRSRVELRVDGPGWDDDPSDHQTAGEIEIEIGIILAEQQTESQTYAFRAEIEPESQIVLGSRLGGAFVSVPCSVLLGGAQELELTAPVDISARAVTLEARTLVLRTPHQSKDAQVEVLVDAGRLDARIESITTNGVPLAFAIRDIRGISYPAVQYVQKVAAPPADPLFSQKYFRLKRILMEFRSHSKGALARYQRKIEHERVLKNEVGRRVLDKLVRDGILELRGKFYYLDLEKLSTHTGVSWQILRTGAVPPQLEAYIRSVN